MGGVSAFHTQELALTLSVRFFDVSTGKTALARVAWINHAHWNASTFCFVGKESSQLSERPIAVFCSCVCALDPCPRANARQIFYGYRPIRVYSAFHKFLTDAVIHVRLKTTLFTRQSFQVAFGGARVSTLQITPEALMFNAIAFNDGAAGNIPVAGGSDIHHAHIDTQCAFGLFLARIGNVASRKNVERALVVDQISFASLILQEVVLKLPGDIRNIQPSGNAPNRNAAQVGVPLEDTVIVGNRTAFAEGALRFLVQLVSVSDLRNKAHNHLRGQVERCTNIMIDKFLQPERGEYLCIPSTLADVVASGICLFQCLE